MIDVSRLRLSRGLIASPFLLLLLNACQMASLRPIPPASWTSSAFTAPDGQTFPYTRWMPDGPPRAIILAIHGLGGAASDWRPLGNHMKSRGIAVFAHELRGMGNDPKPDRVGQLEDPAAWFHDFVSFAKRIQMAYPDTPIFWYGESLGGVIGTRLLTEYRVAELRLNGFILASPIVQIRGKLPIFHEWGLRAGAFLFPRWRIDLQSLAPEDQPPPQVVSTTTHAEQLSRTPHAVTRFSLRLLEEIRRLVRFNRRRIPETEMPY